MPTALLTNLNINSRTGSELHTLEFAKQLQNRGYVVTCFCLCAAYPLLKEFEKEGIEVLTLGDETKLENQYDLFIAQHRVVSEYIYSLQRITFSSIFQYSGSQMNMKACPFSQICQTESSPSAMKLKVI